MKEICRLTDWVVCPSCQGDPSSAQSLTETQKIVCRACASSYQVGGWIPVLMDATMRTAAEAHIAQESTEGYHRACHTAPSNMQYSDFWCEDLLRRLPQRPFRRVVKANGMRCGVEPPGYRPCPPDCCHRPQTHAVGTEPGRTPARHRRAVCAPAERLPFRDASLELRQYDPFAYSATC